MLFHAVNKEVLKILGIRLIASFVAKMVQIKLDHKGKMLNFIIFAFSHISGRRNNVKA